MGQGSRREEKTKVRAERQAASLFRCVPGEDRRCREYGNMKEVDE